MAFAASPLPSAPSLAAEAAPPAPARRALPFEPALGAGALVLTALVWLAAHAAGCASAPELAAEVVSPAGYAFAVDESPKVAAVVRARCAAEAPLAVDACVDETRREGASERVRFERAPGGDPRQLVFVSYGLEGTPPVETVFHRVRVRVEEDDGHVLVARTEASAEGALAARRPLPPGTRLRVRRLADDRLALEDPEKGELVYRRVP